MNIHTYVVVPKIEAIEYASLNFGYNYCLYFFTQMSIEYISLNFGYTLLNSSNYLLFTQMCIEYTSLNFGYKNSIIRQFHSLSIDTFAASYTMLTSLPGFNHTRLIYLLELAAEGRQFQHTLRQ